MTSASDGQQKEYSHTSPIIRKTSEGLLLIDKRSVVDSDKAYSQR